MQTFLARAGSAFELILTGGMIEIGGRAADVVDVAFEIRILGYLFRFLHNRLPASRGNHPALVIRQRAEARYRNNRGWR